MADRPALSRTDLRMIDRALRSGWNIPPKLLDALPIELVRIINTARNREKLRAIEVFLKMLEQNMALASADGPGDPPPDVTAAQIHLMDQLTAPHEAAA